MVCNFYANSVLVEKKERKKANGYNGEFNGINKKRSTICTDKKIGGKFIKVFHLQCHRLFSNFQYFLFVFL